MSRKPQLPIQLAVFATAWGSTHGGINSFNRDFCCALAKYSGSRVACIVPGASDEDKQDAARNSVLLLSLGTELREGFDVGSAPIIPRLADLNRVRYWIGHDIVTGEFAARVKNASGTGQLAVIMHQSYEAYEAVKHLVGDLSNKARRQKELFAKAEKVFAVGPLLHERLLDFSKTAQLVVPGLRNLNHHPARNTLKVVIFGRLTQDNALIKGIELAGHAVAEAVKTTFAARADSIAEQTLIKFIGADPASSYSKQIKQEIERRAGRCLNVQMLPYLPIPTLTQEIEGANLSLMLSWHEGFGLAGWEAIGAGIPVILSRNSGVYELLDDLGGRARGCVKSLDIRGSSGPEVPFLESDLRAASDAVLETIRDIETAVTDASSLKAFLLERGYTWESAARRFVEGLGHELLLNEPPEVSKVKKKRNVGRQIKRRGASRTRVESAEATSRNEHTVAEMIAAAGLTAFYPSRGYYHIFRATNTIDTYVSTAQNSIVMVSINLMTGVPFDGLCDVLKDKLENSDKFSVVISLLDPTKPWLMQALAPVLDMEPYLLRNSIVASLRKLWTLRNSLSSSARQRFSLRVHQAIPFGSAILLDHAESRGRIQIETKVYRVALRKSFAFEVGTSGASGLYNTLVSGYLNLIGEGREVDSELVASDSASVPTAD